MSKLDTLFASYAANPLVQAGLAEIDKEIAANPLVANDGKRVTFDMAQYRAFIETEAAKEKANPTAALKTAFSGKPSFQTELNFLKKGINGAAVSGLLNLQGHTLGDPNSFQSQAMFRSNAEYWRSTESAIQKMPPEQQKLVRTYYELQAAKSKSGDGFLGALKIGLVAFAGWALAPAVSAAFKGATAGIGAAGNVSTGIQLAKYAGEGVQVANVAAPIGTGIQIAPAAYDAAIASTSGGLFSGLSKVLDYAKTGSNVVKAGQVVSGLVSKPAAADSGGSQGAIELNFNDAASGTVAAPNGAVTGKTSTETVPVSVGGGTNWLPILLLAGVGYLAWKGQK